jgi:hypothetical protein
MEATMVEKELQLKFFKAGSGGLHYSRIVWNSSQIVTSAKEQVVSP